MMSAAFPEDMRGDVNGTKDGTDASDISADISGIVPSGGGLSMAERIVEVCWTTVGFRGALWDILL
ncbi:MAG: hypothetical protein K9L28_06180 [Synergistales bacterium]|nr:hypothetical protein [Synergistales bacterium]